MYSENQKELETLKEEMDENNESLLMHAIVSFLSVIVCTTLEVYFDSSKWLSYAVYAILFIIFCYTVYLNISTTKKYFACKKELNGK
ncbi:MULTISPECIES: hypothetical protein [Bacillus]|uniref:Uncharacterized protein n=1 Tax=Bacillus cereus TaxID=1396 RepID=A0A9X6ZEU5_BACCE|nr:MULTISPECIES: hypothetical protein [Bacillus cereus group]PEZ75421.1 hypothetical protein CN410_15300 [Bacillus anthracis]KXY51272.1 hypothetical protein AT268_32825 [Bacillus cereus]PFA29610.1 hypothetical protein CN384_07945 [Bacillus thuringiensis]PFF45954.1 hypothetical protein CN357_21075 [Bacillus cereus]PFQ36571.1 hypothetical protein COK33_17580 [Bacillus cereus]